MAGQISCKYHPESPARWSCPNCDIDLCSACVKEGSHGEAVCPACRQAVDSLGLGNVITPFWQRIPRFFIYPATGAAPVYLLGLAIFMTVVAFVPLFGPLLYLALFLGFLKYAFQALEHTAAGHLKPPAADWRLSTDGMEMPLKVFAIFVLLGVIYYYIGPGILWVALLLFFYLALPAMTMIIATENSFFKAINPLLLVQIIARIGIPYFVLYLFLVLLSGGWYAVLSLLYPVIPKFALLPTVNFVYMYFIIIMFNMMGYVIYQYHETLGFNVEVDFEQQDEAAVHKTVQELDPVQNEVSILINEGKLPEAIAVVETALKTRPQDPALHERYHKLLQLAENNETLVAHGPHFIANLVAERKFKRALDVFSECRALDKNFQLTSPDDIHLLAEQAKQTGRPKLALDIMNGYAKRFPNHPHIPGLYLMAARILCEDLKQDGAARQLLEDLRRRYPTHELGPEIERYLKLVQGLAT